jgi:hypothetical protein
MNALQAIRAADRYKINEEFVDIPLDGENVIHAKLVSPDLFQIQEELDDFRKEAYVELREKGYCQKPIDEDEWNTEITGYKESEAYKELSPKDRKKRLDELEKGKPKNLAEQRAPYKARTRIVRHILPRLLRYADNNELLFPTDSELREFAQILGSKPDLMKLLSDAYVRLSSKNNEDAAEVDELKNESAPVSVENGN